jgi:hypothetical protein
VVRHVVIIACLAGCTARPAPAVVAAGIRWPPASAVDHTVLDGLPPAVKEKVAAAPLPVLLPPRIDYGRAALIVEAEYYALSAPDGGVTIALQGSKLAYRWDAIPAQPGRRALRGGTGLVTVNEGIRTASFTENGVAYALDVECAAHDDPRCADDAFLTALVEGLAFVGGKGP